MAHEISRLAALVERYEAESEAARATQEQQARAAEEATRRDREVAAEQLRGLQKEVDRLLDQLSQYEKDHAADRRMWESRWQDET